MPFFNKTKAAAQNNYMVLSYKSEYGLKKAANLLTARQAVTGDANEVTTITVGLAKIKADIYRVDADRQAVLAEMTAFNPPSSDDVAKVLALSTSLSQMVANSVLTDDILNASTQIMNIWSGTK